MSRYLPDDNLCYPVLVKTGDSSGSAFFVRKENDVYFVTAKHVIYHQVDGVDQFISPIAELSVPLNPNWEDACSMTINLETIPREKVRCHSDVDVVVIKIAELELIEGNRRVHLEAGVTTPKGNRFNIVGVPSENFKKYSEVLVSNEVFIFGYPNSIGIPGRNQIDYSRPLLRKGIVAGKNESNKTIILDCPAYFGNSGGLVIEVEEISFSEKKFRAIGVLTQYIPFVELLESKQNKYINTNIENSGYSIAVPIETIEELFI